MAIVKEITSVEHSQLAGDPIQIQDISTIIGTPTSVESDFTKAITYKGVEYNVPRTRYYNTNLSYNEQSFLIKNSKLKIPLGDNLANGNNDKESILLRIKLADDLYYCVNCVKGNNVTFELMLTTYNESNNKLVYPTITYRDITSEFTGDFAAIWILEDDTGKIGIAVGSGDTISPFVSNVGIRLYDFSVFPNFKLEIEEYDDNYGKPSGTGGYTGGGFDDSSDEIGIPNNPAIGVTDTGFMNIYAPSLNSLTGLGDELFPDFGEREFTNDVAENIKIMGQTLYDGIQSFINSQLINYVVDCHLIPVSPLQGASDKIKIGFKYFTQKAPKVTSDYVTFDCGTLEISEYYSNFIDYVGTKAQLYLPFVGFVGIEPEYFQGGTLNVQYKFNVIDGSFVAFVLSSSSKSKLRNSVIGQYAGTSCVHIPITGANYSSMISGTIQGAKALSDNLNSGETGLAINSAIGTLSAKPTMEASNAYNSTSGFMGVRYPYLLISRQVASFPLNYAKEKGLPLNATERLGDLTGFTIVESPVLTGLSCTDDEKEMLRNLLESGIIL